MPDQILQTPNGGDDPQEDADLVSQLETLLSEDGDSDASAEVRAAVISNDRPDADADDFETLSKEVESLLGGPVDRAVDRIGEPDVVGSGETLAVDHAAERRESSEAVDSTARDTTDPVTADQHDQSDIAVVPAEVVTESVTPTRIDAPVAAEAPLEASNEQPEDDSAAQAKEQVAEAAPTLEQVDAMLAEGADAAVGDDFETVGDTNGEAPARHVDAHSAADAVDPTPAPAPKPQQARPIEGRYLTPEQILSGNVSEENPDESAAAVEPPVPEQQIGANTEPQPVAAAAPSLLQRLLTFLRPRAVGLPARLRRLCAWINRPVNRMTPVRRTAVGYVALVTTFNASVLLIGKLIGVVLGY